jgi:2-keto-3-deoxy-6-phosphogluconate aldolase
MSRVFDVYRALHEQAFLPIFCENTYNSKAEVEACAALGLKVIEYTLRCEDAREMIPWIRSNYPDLHVLVGSTLDDDKIVAAMRRRHPQLMTLDEIADLDVHGFVSRVGWRRETIERFSPTHLVVPAAMTVTEALLQTSWGSHFQKMDSQDSELLRRSRVESTFEFCPIVASGDLTLQRVPEVFHLGSMVAGCALDVALMGADTQITAEEITSILRTYWGASRRARAQHYPRLADTQHLPADEWLKILPHYHPFD